VSCSDAAHPEEAAIRPLTTPGVLDNVEFLVIIIAYNEHSMGLLKGGIGPRGIDFLLVFWIVKEGSQVTACRSGSIMLQNHIWQYKNIGIVMLNRSLLSYIAE
jgi:hypothetical protein